MTIEQFRIAVMDRGRKDDEIKEIFVRLAKDASWQLANRKDKSKPIPLEYIVNGDALSFICVHRPELHAKLTKGGRK